MHPELLKAFDALAPHCEVSASLCNAAADGVLAAPQDLHGICGRIGLAHSRAADLQRSLRIGQACGLFEQTAPLSWCACDRELAEQLAPLLNGARLYRERVHRDADQVDVVLTKPPAPSQVSLRLEAMLEGSFGFRDTRQLLPAIAESATETFVVMTPYFDDVGASVVLNLFHRAQVGDRCLILRTGKDSAPPSGLATVRDELAQLGVAILNFRLDRPDGLGNETFHAKVVLADDKAVYVGSSNMNQWSFEYSLELGLYVRGKAAAKIASLVRAVRDVSGLMS